jgi:hypothetical protein
MGYGVRFPAEERDFSRLHNVQTGTVAYLASYTMGNGGSFPVGEGVGEWRWLLTSI